MGWILIHDRRDIFGNEVRTAKCHCQDNRSALSSVCGSAGLRLIEACTALLLSFAKLSSFLCASAFFSSQIAPVFIDGTAWFIQQSLGSMSSHMFSLKSGTKIPSLVASVLFGYSYMLQEQMLLLLQ